MERIRDNWSAILILALLVGGATYVHSIESSLGTFLWIVAALVIGVAVLGPLISSATEPLWGHLSRTQREAVTGYMFVLPWLFGFLVFTFGPMLFSFYTSFCSYNITGAPQWKGWDYNYGNILQHDATFIKSLQNTVWYVAVKTPIVIIASLALALLMNQRVPGIRFFRTIFYMPTVVTGAAAIFLWAWVLQPNGVLNQGLSKLGIQGPFWFLDPAWSKPALVVMGTWYIGSPMLILLAGLNGVPRQLYEAAEVEGAGIIRQFWSITIPMLSPTLFFLILTNVIGAFQVFNSAFILSTATGGGNTNAGDPAQSLMFVEIYLYTKFRVLDMGYASAIAWILFVIILVITAIQLYLSKRWVYYESG